MGDDIIMSDGTVYTYFIQAANGGRVKIGKAKNPKQRLRELQTGNSEHLQLLGVTSDLSESYLHVEFYEQRKQGEWFDVNEAMVEMLAVSGISVIQPDGLQNQSDLAMLRARTDALALYPGTWFFNSQMEKIRRIQGLQHPKPTHPTICECEGCYGASAFDDLCTVVKQYGTEILGFTFVTNSDDSGCSAESGDLAILLHRDGVDREIMNELAGGIFWGLDAVGNCLHALSWAFGEGCRDENLMFWKDPH
jgi:hypothetical protein